MEKHFSMDFMDGEDIFNIIWKVEQELVIHLLKEINVIQMVHLKIIQLIMS